MKTSDRKPTVYIYEAMANPACIKEICAGLEEEGIPFTIFKIMNENVKTLAIDAASHSRLRVGLGITTDQAALQIRNCPVDKPVFLIELENSQLRKLGQNAARAVKGGVFK